VKHPALVVEALEEQGWWTSVAAHPRALRLVLMPHVTRARAREFARDLRLVCERLGEIPRRTSGSGRAQR